MFLVSVRKNNFETSAEFASYYTTLIIQCHEIHVTIFSVQQQH